MQEEYLGYYANFDEDNRLTSQNITRLEFDTTVNRLSQYVRQSKTLTELGAATGRYSLHFAQRGMDVTAVELVPELVEQLKKNSELQELDIHIHEANATQLDFIPDSSQDIVLALGPFYHLQSSSERQAVVDQACRVLKKGGIFAVAYISRFFVAGLLAKMSPYLVAPEILSELNETGLVTTPNVDAFFRTGYFAKPSEMETLLTKNNFKLESHISTDGFSRYIGQEVNQLTEEQYQAWLSYHLSVCEEPSLLGSSNHGLVIARKD